MVLPRKSFFIGFVSCFLTISVHGQESKSAANVAASGPQKEVISEIDFEYSASSILCARQRIVLHVNGSAELFTERCRNATREDRTTFCEVKKGHLSAGTFAKLAHLLETNSFFELQPEYWGNVTDAVFESTRAKRDGKTQEVINYADAGPFTLWAIQRAIEGSVFDAEWQSTTRRSKCPRWDDKRTTHPD